MPAHSLVVRPPQFLVLAVSLIVSHTTMSTLKARMAQVIYPGMSIRSTSRVVHRCTVPPMAPPKSGPHVWLNRLRESRLDVHAFVAKPDSGLFMVGAVLRDGEEPSRQYMGTMSLGAAREAASSYGFNDESVNDSTGYITWVRPGDTH
jgi:hypothetical protein